MAGKRHKAEKIIMKLRQVDVLTARGKAIRSIGVTQATYYRWQSEYGSVKGDQVKRLTIFMQREQRAEIIKALLCLSAYIDGAEDNVPNSRDRLSALLERLESEALLSRRYGRQ